MYLGVTKPMLQLVLAALLVFPVEAHNMVAQRWQGQYGGGRFETSEIVRTQEQWQNLWQRLDRAPPQPLQAGRQIAIFVGSGERPEPGYQLRLVTTVLRDDRLLVVWEGSPADAMRVASRPRAASSVQPWLVVLIDRADLAPLIEQRVR